MKILSALQIREADQHTIQNEPITSIDLMERASEAFVCQLKYLYPRYTHFSIVCGCGNNGGDGLAIARILGISPNQVKVFILSKHSKPSIEFITNFEKLKQTNISITEIESPENLPKWDTQEIVIDAIFGIGNTRPADGLVAQIIDHINLHQGLTIAVDMPSGLNCSEPYIGQGSIVYASDTITLARPKLVQLFPENQMYVGNLHVVPIGLDQKFIETLTTDWNYITENEVKVLPVKRQKSDYKNIFGHALICAGSYGKIGAAVLAGRACMRSGAGLLTMQLPDCGYEVVQATIPEAIVKCDDQYEFITEIVDTKKYDAVGIGPGIGTVQFTVDWFKKFVPSIKVPLVIDADGINILGKFPNLMHILPKNTILTPHLGEFKRCFGNFKSSYSAYMHQKEISVKYGIFIILKGPNTHISFPNGQSWLNSTGNSGMATAGSGDALIGIITSLLAQGCPEQNACLLGVYLHGLAGDLAREKVGEISLMAGDIIDHIPAAYLKLST